MNRLRAHYAPIVVGLLALAATATSLRHDFTYDDRYVILLNDLVHHLSGLRALWHQTYWPPVYGGDGYRPVVMTLFTLEWVARDGAPWVFHLVNIVLAVATAVAVWWCAAAFLPEAAALAAGALFAVHPVHVEVTGNVVGQSELVVALCLAIATGVYIRRRLAGALSGRDMLAILALFAVALFAKEHAVVLPGLLLAAEVTVARGEDWRARVREARPLALALVAVCLAYLFVRGQVQSDIAGFQPFPAFRFLHLGALNRTLTMMTEVPRIARLLVFPTHLSADYSPPDVIIANGFDAIQLPGIMITLGVAILAVALRRRSPAASFGLSWLIMSYLPVSNILVAAGFMTAERTLFLPSIGVAFIAGAVVEQVLRVSPSLRTSRVVYATVSLLVILGAVRSIDRQRVWKNNDVFISQLVKDSPMGYRAHFVRGRHLAYIGDKHTMELEYRRAIRLFPYDAGMTLTVAADYTHAGFWKPAADLFEWTYQVEPRTGEGRYMYVYCLWRLKRWKELREQAIAGIALVAPADVKQMHRAVIEANNGLRAQVADHETTTLAIRDKSALSR